MEHSNKQISYFNFEESKNFDEEMMRDHGFTLDIMMELAGQSVANSVYNLN
jgi:hypothetical protein